MSSSIALAGHGEQAQAQVLDLHADRNEHALSGQQSVRLWRPVCLPAVGALAHAGLSGTELERPPSELATEALKIAAQVRVSVRRVYVQ